jgi:hypothetical protein
MMNPRSDMNIWHISRVAAFWDRPHLTHDKWLKSILIRDAKGDKMLLQSLIHMSDSYFIELVGLPVFIAHYPQWRELLIDDMQRAIMKKCTLDARWSQEVCGTVYVKHPTTEWFNLTKKQKETFMCISNFGYESIYQVAKRMQRNYRRVHDDVKRLIELKLIQAREKTVNGKRTIIVGL